MLKAAAAFARHDRVRPVLVGGRHAGVHAANAVRESATVLRHLLALVDFRVADLRDAKTVFAKATTNGGAYTFEVVKDFVVVITLVVAVARV